MRAWIVVLSIAGCGSPVVRGGAPPASETPAETTDVSDPFPPWVHSSIEESTAIEGTATVVLQSMPIPRSAQRAVAWFHRLLESSPLRRTAVVEFCTEHGDARTSDARCRLDRWNYENGTRERMRGYAPSPLPEPRRLTEVEEAALRRTFENRDLGVPFGMESEPDVVYSLVEDGPQVCLARITRGEAQRAYCTSGELGDRNVSYAPAGEVGIHIVRAGESSHVIRFRVSDAEILSRTTIAITHPDGRLISDETLLTSCGYEKRCVVHLPSGRAVRLPGAIPGEVEDVHARIQDGVVGLEFTREGPGPSVELVRVSMVWSED